MRAVLLTLATVFVAGCLVVLIASSRGQIPAF